MAIDSPNKTQTKEEFIKNFMAKHSDNFDAALGEIKACKKNTDWMQYIFPQIKGIPEAFGATSSPANNQYSIPDLKTAKNLLNDETFAKNYLKILNEVDKQCKKPNNGYNMEYLQKLFNGDDALKFVSSITLFDKALTKVTDPSNEGIKKSIKALITGFFTQVKSDIKKCSHTDKIINTELQSQVSK